MSIKGSIGKLKRGTVADTLTDIAGVLEVSPPEGSAPTEDVTALGDANVKKAAGLVEYAPLKASILYEHAIAATLQGDLTSGTDRFWAIELGTKTTSVTGPLIKFAPRSFSNKSAALMADIEIQVNAHVVDDTEE